MDHSKEARTRLIQSHDDIQRALAVRGDAIRRRLEDFESVQPEEWFWEFAYGLLTPQSRARHADIVIRLLRERDFLVRGGQIVDILRTPEWYIRFHNVKAERLERLRASWNDVAAFLHMVCQQLPDRGRTHINEARTVRDELVARIVGYGIKEASHVLRNIGWRNLAIIDRHLITNLSELGVFDSGVRLHSTRQYHTLESTFAEWCSSHGYDMDEIDLLFWSEQTGEILK